MQADQKKPETQTPADIAREAFRRLAARRIAPTPDAYREIYEEILGVSGPASAEKVLTEFAASLSKGPAAIAEFAPPLTQALQSRDWKSCSSHLHQLANKHLLQPIRATADAGSQAISSPAPPAEPSTEFTPGRQARMLREMLVRTLRLSASLLHSAPALAEESERLAQSIDDSRTEPALAEITPRLKQLCFQVELKRDDMAKERDLLLRLFKLLLDNVRELLEDDSWLSGQVAIVQHLLSGPTDYDALTDATRSLKEVIYKQSMLKHSLSEAKARFKNMMITFIDRLGAVAIRTGDYHEKIGKYSQQISQAKDIGQLSNLLDQVVHDTRIEQTEALLSRDEMVAVRHQMQQAEARVHELESDLDKMSELVREDQLTGSLNRRGLDDALERELARAERRNSPLCVAMLDLDDFKRLNDTLGHSAGDQALIHLVRVVKDILRSMDVVARFGGEEFLVVLPETSLEDAMQTVTRLQRELTKRIFMHNHERVLITFSAGVALRASGEEQAELIRRADEALYKAKKAGKNRVVSAE